MVDLLVNSVNSRSNEPSMDLTYVYRMMSSWVVPELLIEQRSSLVLFQFHGR